MLPPAGAEVVAARLGERAGRLLELIAELGALVAEAGVDHAAWRVDGPSPVVVRVTKAKGKP